MTERQEAAGWSRFIPTRRFTILLALLIVVAIGVALLSSGTRVPDEGILVVEISGAVPDSPQPDLISQLMGGGQMALPTLLLQLEKAAADERVRGVLLHVRGVALGPAQRTELHDGIRRLRESEKKVVALLDFAQIQAASELYVAAAADEVYVVPGFLGPLAGLAGEFTLLGGLLERLGVAVEYERIGAYKSAPESFTSTELSPPARQMYTELMDGLFEDLVAVISRGRGIEAAELRALIDRAPATAEQWVEAGLADAIVGREEVFAKAGWDDLEEIELGTYLHVSPSDLGLRNGPRIAVIFAEGTVLPGRSGSSTFAADRIGDALEAAVEDESFRAIVLRINSGGGSALASEQIWRAVLAAREKKPVIVSMGDAAASGGYYVASAANAIVAQPTTQTGSIGIFILRASMQKLFESVGVGTELMRRGALAGLATASQPLTAGQRELLQELVRDGYELFVERVSAGRGLTVEEVDAVGQGRVWLGARAREHRLVDRLGGLDAAVALAKAESGIADDTDPERVILPRPASLARQIREVLQGRARGWLLERLWAGAGGPWRGIEELPQGLVQLGPVWTELR